MWPSSVREEITITLREARDLRNDWKKVLAKGQDPSLVRKHAKDDAPLDPACACACCARGYSRAYLRHLYVAGEMMAGNVLGKGYTAGVGMAIGTAFGRIAGTQAAQAAQKLKEVSHAVA